MLRNWDIIVKMGMMIKMGGFKRKSMKRSMREKMERSKRKFNMNIRKSKKIKKSIKKRNRNKKNMRKRKKKKSRNKIKKRKKLKMKAKTIKMKKTIMKIILQLQSHQNILPNSIST